ncbi:MAG TPA: YqeG family HAD IIIA-type phosphatase [Candidatus Onthovivens sp.]|nr:YqeG family HAD IIIA-type phosphatase [Candidatus Onthovivens sp.]
MKKIIPTMCAENIFQIDIQFYINNNFRFVFSDLDNTLNSFDSQLPDKRVIELTKALHDNGIELIIISNNSYARVKKYSEQLNVRFISRAFKPYTKKINNFIKTNNIDKNNAIIIGDQLLTDIKCANSAKIISVLTEDLVEKNSWISFFNKTIEKKLLKKLEKKHLLLNWRDYHGYSKKS